VHFLHADCDLTVEPSGAATTAALRSGALARFREPPLVLVISGGNVDPAMLEEPSPP
jgi:threonine dehydratase